MTRPELPSTIFILGAPRSGTTWLQLLLGRHPAVATANETHVISDYLGPLLRQWDRPDRSNREIGLGTLMRRSEFLEHVRSILRDVLLRIAEDDTRLILEKTPQHALWGRELLEIVPEASILHLVRDPRDVTASLLAASRDWGEGWAPHTAYSAAWCWRDHVRGGRSIRDLTDRYREVSYERLYGNTPGELVSLLDWLGLDGDEELVRDAVKQTGLSRLREGAGDASWDLDSEPDGFFRKGGTGNWRDELSRSQVRTVEHVCRESMRDLGYEPSRRRRVPPPEILGHWIRGRIREWLC